MEKMAHVYFNNREMPVQETVYIVCGLRMKDSCEVKFISTNPNSTRISLTKLRLSKIKTSIWMPNITDKYEERPHNEEFNQMCLAQFGSEFRFTGASDERPNAENEYTL